MWNVPVLLALANLACVVQATSSLGCYLSVNIAKSAGEYSFQSPSYCQQQCSEYAYVALKGGNLCYCLSSFPSGGTTTGCSTSCFGYGQDTCGGSSVYDIYAGTGSQGAETAAALGTAAVLGTTASLSSTLSSKTMSTSTTSSSLESSLSATSETSSSSTSSSLSSDPSSTVSTTTSSETLSASVTTHTSTATATPESDKKKKSSNVGPIVGGVVGGVAGAILIAIAGFFIVRRMRSEDEDDDEYFETKAVSRGTLKKKQNALDMPLQNPQNPFAHPSDATAGPHANGALGDPRLNFNMMGRKRLLEGTLADEADYSRKILQVINPDH